jgi:hypothetical protein
MDGFEFPVWAAEIIRDILKDSCAEISLLVIQGRPDGEKDPTQHRNSILDKIKNLLSGRIHPNKILWALYCHWDRAHVKQANDPFSPTNMTQELKDVSRMHVVPITDRFNHRFEETDLEKIRQADLDVLLRFGFNILKGPILKAARFGVWSFHHGDNQHFRGGPPYFWELYYDVPISGIILQILTEKLDSGRVLYRSYGSTIQGMSVKWNSLSYWKGSSFVIRRLKQLHENGFEWMERELPSLRENPSKQGKLYRTPTNLQMIRFITRGLFRTFFRRLKMTGKIEHWYVTYRDPKESKPFVLPSPKGHYYADPFPIHRDGKDYIFFEDCIYARNHHGVISYVEVRPDLSVTEAKVVLDLPYHLSYPFIFEHEGVVHMIPESAANSSVELYKAVEFPDRWERVKILNEGLKIFDVTLLVKDGVYWFFGSLVDRGEASSDELFLYYADSLTGAWTPHPNNPVISDVRCARPAGKIFERDGKLIRPSQDGSLSYGSAYHLNEILVLSKTDYQERSIEHVQPNWAKNLVGTHTYNRNERIEVIDVRAIRPISEVK